MRNTTPIRSQNIVDGLNYIASCIGKEFPKMDEAEVKSQSISALIRFLIDAGDSVKTAWEKIMGPGSYDALAGQVYDEINAIA